MVESENREPTDYERHLKSGQPDTSGLPQFSKDTPLSGGGEVERVRGGRKRKTPIVLQAGFDEKGEPTVQHQTLTRKRLTPITPLEEERRQEPQGFIDSHATARANAQRYAIKRHGRKPR